MNKHRPVSQKDLQRQLFAVIQGMTEEEKWGLLASIRNTSGNKRRNLRRALRIPADCLYDGQTYTVSIENLSPVGAYLSTDRPLPPGREMTLRFSILNFEFPVTLKAEKVWQTASGVGVRFKPNSDLSYRLSVQKLSDLLTSFRSA